MFNKDRKTHSKHAVEKIEGRICFLHSVGINLAPGSTEEKRLLVEIDRLQRQKTALIIAEDEPDITMSMLVSASSHSIEGFNFIAAASKISSASSDKLSDTWCEACIE